MMTDCANIDGIDCKLKMDDEFCDSLCRMYENWMDYVFEKWWDENQKRFHCGQFEEKQIARAAFDKGLMSQK